MLNGYAEGAPGPPPRIQQSCQNCSDYSFTSSTQKWRDLQSTTVEGVLVPASALLRSQQIMFLALCRLRIKIARFCLQNSRMAGILSQVSLTSRMLGHDTNGPTAHVHDVTNLPLVTRFVSSSGKCTLNGTAVCSLELSLPSPSGISKFTSLTCQGHFHRESQNKALTSHPNGSMASGYDGKNEPV